MNLIVVGLISGLVVLFGFRYIVVKKEPNHEYNYFSVETFLSDLKQFDRDVKIVVISDKESAYELVTEIMKSNFRIENVRASVTDNGSYRYDFVLRYNFKERNVGIF